MYLQLQNSHAKNKVTINNKEIEYHNQKVVDMDEQISHLVASLQENENKLAAVQTELLLSENYQNILKLTLSVKELKLKQQLERAENEKWLSQFKLRKAEKDLKMYKSMIVSWIKLHIDL